MNTTERRGWEQQGEVLGHTSQRLRRGRDGGQQVSYRGVWSLDGGVCVQISGRYLIWLIVRETFLLTDHYLILEEVALWNQEPPSWGAKMLWIVTVTEFAISSLLSVSKPLLLSSMPDWLSQISIFSGITLNSTWLDEGYCGTSCVWAPGGEVMEERQRPYPVFTELPDW